MMANEYKDLLDMISQIQTRQGICGGISQGVRELIADAECLREWLNEAQAILDKLSEHDHHALQAGFDEEDGAIDPEYYDDAADESRLAQEALEQAVLLCRQIAHASSRAGK